MNLFKSNEKIKKAAEKKLEEDIKAFIEEVNTIVQKHKIGMKPVITPDGPAMRYFRIE